MFKTFYPDQYLASTYVIDFEKLYKEGFRGLIFDIDNTLVPHNAPADDRAIALFERLKSIGYRCCLISNNQEPRVKMFNEKIQVDYVYNAHKPSTKNYIRRHGDHGNGPEQHDFYRRPSFLQTCGGQKGQGSLISW